MQTPNKIYLQVCGDCPQTDCDDCKFEDLESNVTWCRDRIFEKDKEYISKEYLQKLLDDEKEKTGIGLSEYDAGHENGRMEVIISLTNIINNL